MRRVRSVVIPLFELSLISWRSNTSVVSVVEIFVRKTVEARQSVGYIQIDIFSLSN